MHGFDKKFADFPDYIVGITKEIWEDRGIATLHDYYAPDIIVRTPAGISRGNQGVIAATMATLAEFPDRTLLGEDVIWSGSPQDGLLSSHRILSQATHSGNGSLGKATGTRLTYRILADCHAKNNIIDDEWLIRDIGAIVRQLGWDVADFARTQIEREGGISKCARPFTREQDVQGPYQSHGNDNEWGARHASVLTGLMNADFGSIEREYDRAVQSEFPGGVTGHGHAAIDRFWLGLRSSFPSADFKIEHQIGRSDKHMPPRSALRWSLTGRHDGWGTFGQPTGADIHVMGMSHMEFGSFGVAPVKVRREYSLFDEVAIWKQIVMHNG